MIEKHEEFHNFRPKLMHTQSAELKKVTYFFAYINISGGQNLQSPSPSRSKQSFMLRIFVILVCSENVGVFDCMLANVAEGIGVATAAAEVELTGALIE